MQDPKGLKGKIISQVQKGRTGAAARKGVNMTVENLERANESMCVPEYLGENTAIGCRIGECTCGNIVRSYQKYCDECGIRLEWRDVNAGTQ